MKSIVDRMVMEGKTVRNALVAVFALVVGAAMPSFAAERTVSGAYTLTANGLFRNQYSGRVQSEVTLDDLFAL